MSMERGMDQMARLDGIMFMFGEFTQMTRLFFTVVGWSSFGSELRILKGTCPSSFFNVRGGRFWGIKRTIVCRPGRIVDDISLGTALN